jgi:hypothetical protein
MKSFAISASASGVNNLIATPGVGKFLRIHAYVIVAANAVNVTFQDTAAVAATGAFPLAANCGVCCPMDTHDGYFDLATNVGLDMNLSGAVGVYGHISYTIRG